MNPVDAVDAAVEMYDAELSRLNEELNCDVVIVCRPDELPEQTPLHRLPITFDRALWGGPSIARSAVTDLQRFQSRSYDPASVTTARLGWLPLGGRSVGGVSTAAPGRKQSA